MKGIFFKCKRCVYVYKAKNNIDIWREPEQKKSNLGNSGHHNSGTVHV